MSLRIRKALGYGLRFPAEDTEKYLNKGHFSVSLEGYFDYLESLVTTDESSADAKEELATLRSYDFTDEGSKSAGRDFVKVADGQGHDDTVSLVIIPPMMKDDWYHHDDDIDYAESKGTGTTVQYLEDGVFPWSGSYINSSNGQRVSLDDVNNIRYMEGRLYGTDSLADDERTMETLNNLAVRSGFTSYADYNNNLSPYVPNSVKFIARYLEVFNSEHEAEMLEKLYPMVLTYWA